MYRNRKKIIAVSVTSVVVLACFGVGTWAIINQSYKTPLDSSIKAKLNGATVYLGDDGAFQYGEMSFNDWLIYNMPQTVIYSTTGTITTYQYYTGTYSTSDNTASGNKIATLSYDSSNNTSSMTTGIDSDTNLVSATYSKTSTSLSFQNTYSWNSEDNTSYVLSSSDGSSYSLTGTGLDNNEFTLSYTSTVDTSNNTTDSTSIKSNTGTLIWSRTVSIPATTGSAIVVVYASDALGSNNDLTITYTPSTSNAVTYYSVSYKIGSSTNNITTQSALLSALLSDTSDYSTSKLTTKDYLLYVPYFA